MAKSDKVHLKKKTKALKIDKELNKSKPKIKTNKKRISYFKITSVILISILILFLILWLISETTQIKIDSSIFIKNEKSYSLKDACTLIVGKLIHPIKNLETCEQLCKEKCELTNTKYVKVDFQENISDCNQCTCYCK